MESTARLDYALFQLTPTRTRFDLVVFLRGNNEKLASGLFEPFISHLKFARDEISKGGYSITLRPPTHDAFWFTKATFQRFVRFVSTPAVLERFVTLEREILQIEGSILANESSNGQLERQGSGTVADGITRSSSDSIKLKSELARDEESVQEENSKIQLQRLLETRIALLRKEQAMAYARGLVAGFEIESIGDLTSFADAYGASRLKEACINFKELWRKKHADRVWMEELAAMEACNPSELLFPGTSGIVLANENGAPNPNALLNIAKVDESHEPSEGSQANSDSKKDDNSSPAKVQVPIAWPNQLPPYMYGFQSPMQQLPPYQGYPFPPMQPIPPHYAANMPWPTKTKSSSGKRGKSRNRNDTQDSGEEEQTESSESESDSNLDQDEESPREHTYRKKNKKKSSKTVVIRNINYITPKRRNGESDASYSDEDELIDEDDLRKKVNDAVGLLKKSHKSSHRKERGVSKNLVEQDFDTKSVTDEPKGGKNNEDWGAFQSLLMRDEEEVVNQQVDVGDDRYTVENLGGGVSAKKVTKQRITEADSFIVTSREENSEGTGIKFDDFENGENLRPVVKRMDCADAELVFSGRSEESHGENGLIIPSSANESRVAKSARGEDWFVAFHTGESDYQKPVNEQSIFDGDCMLAAGDNFTPKKQKKEEIIDDSFMVQPRLVADDNMYDSQWKTADSSIVADLSSALAPGNNTADASHEKHMFYEPDDLYMMIGRESVESATGPFSLDYGIDASFEEASNSKCNNEDKKKPAENGEVAASKSNGTRGAKTPGKDGISKVARGSLGRGKPDLVPRNRKSPLVNRPTVHKSKFEKEEEMRKRMEELAIQRQKRIAERTAASGLAPAASKKVPLQSKTAKARTPTRETNRVSTVKIRAT